MKDKVKALRRRGMRVRNKLREVQGDGRCRLSVFRSSKHIYAQIIDDKQGVTRASASTLEKDIRVSGESGATVAAAKEVGKKLAERAVTLGISSVIFDRGPYLYHGRVKGVADGARELGLNF